MSILLFFSCGSTKDIVYFQDAQPGEEIKITHTPITLRPEDKISIIVNTRDNETTRLLNLPTINKQLGSASSNSSSSGVSAYTIDSEGNINFPMLGKINITGMTRSQVAEHIKQKLIDKKLVQEQDVIVTVEFVNLTYSILGEIKSPNRYSIDRDAITIIDAISQAGDLTIEGERTNIKVLRKEEDNVQKVYTVNMCSLEELQSSPVYYVQQNDVIYIEPNDKRKRQSTVNGNNVRSSAFWVSIASLLTSITSLLSR